ncbi:MAG: AI-2E family transporter [Bryobacteraceae bacterium]|nr:AI-2E family transporter [Bryobacteraceae bacterium]
MNRDPSRRDSMIALLVMLAVALYLVWQMLTPYLNAIFLACVLGISGFPIYAALERRWRRPALASLAATLTIMLLIAGPLLFLAVTVAREAQSLYQTLAAASRTQGGWNAWVSNVLERPLAWLAQSTGMAVPNLQAALMARLQDAVNVAMARIGGLFGNLTATLGQAAIMFFALYFFFQAVVHMQAMAIRWVPLPAHRVTELIRVTAETIRANVNGTLIVACAQGALMGAGFAIVGLPQALLWGVIGIFSSLVPLVGTSLVWIPAVAYLALSGSWIRALILLVWCLVVVGVSDNILRPWILRGSMPMNTLLVVLSIFGGIEYFGLAGIIAGPVVFSVTAALLRILREMLEENKDQPEES